MSRGKLTRGYVISKLLIGSIIFPLVVTHVLAEDNTVSLLKEFEQRGQGVEPELVEQLRSGGELARAKIFQYILQATPERKYMLTNMLLKVHVPCGEIGQLALRLIKDDFYLVRRNTVQLITEGKCRSHVYVLREQYEVEMHDVVREALIDAFGEVGDSSDIQRISDIQNNNKTSFEMRLTAAKALLALGTTANMKLIKDSLGSSNQQIRSRAVVALSHAGRDAISDLKPFIKADDMDRHDDAGMLSMLARGSVLEIEVRTASSAIEKLFEFLSSQHPVERRRASYLLVKDHFFPGVKNRLMLIMNDPKHVGTMEATQALYESGNVSTEELHSIMRRGVGK